MYAVRKALGELISVRSSQHSTVLELFCPSGDNLSVENHVTRPNNQISCRSFWGPLCYLLYALL